MLFNVIENGPTKMNPARGTGTTNVSEANRYRAMQARAAITRSSALEAYAADGARIDQQANQPHQHSLVATVGAWP
jgi:hypothetical protein